VSTLIGDIRWIFGDYYRDPDYLAGELEQVLEGRGVPLVAAQAPSTPAALALSRWLTGR
jgi:hypothetical protein